MLQALAVEALRHRPAKHGKRPNVKNRSNPKNGSACIRASSEASLRSRSSSCRVPRSIARLAGMAGEFYRQRVGQHLEIGLKALKSDIRLSMERRARHSVSRL